MKGGLWNKPQENIAGRVFCLFKSFISSTRATKLVRKKRGVTEVSSQCS